MKKLIVLLMGLVLTGAFAVSAQAETSHTLTANVGVSLTSITISDTSINFGNHVIADPSYYQADKAITVNNVGTEPVYLFNNTTNFVDTSGVADWMIGGSPDVDRVELMASTGGGFQNLVAGTLVQVRATQLLGGQNQAISYQMNMPTASASIGAHTATITIVAN